MIAVALLVVAIIGFDMYADWVTPYLEQVRRERGEWPAMMEALEIMTL